MFSKILIANCGEIACPMFAGLALATATFVPAAANACAYSTPEPSEAAARASSTAVVSGRYDVKAGRAGRDPKSRELWWAGAITAARVAKGPQQRVYRVSNREDLQQGCPRSWLPDPARHPRPYRGTFFLEPSGRDTYMIIKFVPNRKR